MAKTNVATTQTQPKETKMAQARRIYDEIHSKGYDLAGLTPRREFINRAAAELGMAQAGANTYFQNLKNEDEGKGRYAYSPTSPAPTKESKEAGQSIPEGDVFAQLQILTTSVNRLNRQLDRMQRQLNNVQQPA